MTILEDLDPMPFGKHQGKPMQDVPASYLHWLWTNGKEQDKDCPVADYIRRNLNSLKQEHTMTHHDQLLEQQTLCRQEAERTLARMSDDDIQWLTGRDKERLCSNLGLDTQGWDDQLHIRLQEHKRKLAP